MQLDLCPFHDWLVDLRRHFHQHPELAYGEVKTAARITEVLNFLGLEVHTEVGTTGVVGRLRCQTPGPTVALRADMDALPLQETNQVPYKSRHQGMMHACGHDGHLTIALGVARQLVEQDWRNNGRGQVLFIFQPAEEGGAGARAMLESGFFDREAAALVLAGHLHPELPVGHIGLVSGVSNAASDAISIQIIGKGGHGAQPHLCIDPIVAGSHLVAQVQTIISRNVPAAHSAVLTFGSFQAGTARNIIPQEARLEGTLRTLNDDTRTVVLERLKEMATGLEKSFRTTVKIDVEPGYPLLVNDPQVVEFVLNVARSHLQPDHVHVQGPRMGAEDFAFFLQKWPGALVRLGCSNPEEGIIRGLHSPSFDFDERTLDVGVRLFAQLLCSYVQTSHADKNSSA